MNQTWFDTITIKAEGEVRAAILARAEAAELNFRIDRDGLLGVLVFDEAKTPC